MFTIIGADGKAYGPVPADKVREWIAGGRANLQTKAQRVGEPEWKTLGDFPEFAPAPPVVTPPVVAAPDVPGGTAPAPSPEPLTGDAKTIADTLKARAAKIDVFGCLGQSFELWKSNFLPLVGITLLVLIVRTVVSLVPVLGGLAVAFFLNGVFQGGLYYYYLGRMRGEQRDVGDAFAGFSKAFGPLALATLLTTIITLAIIIGAMLMFCAPLLWAISQAALHGGTLHPDQMPQMGPLAGLGLFVAVLVALYLSISWAFAFVLVIDQGLGPWTAMEVSRRVVGSQWFRVFFTLLFGGILTMLGLFGLIIGIFFTLPLVFGALLYAYEELFATRKA